MKKRISFRLLPVFFALIAVAPAFAGIGTSIMRTAGVRAPGEFEAKLQGDIIFNSDVSSGGGSGFNISPHVVTGLMEHYIDIDAFIGTGSTDFIAGATGKFNFLPDIEGQVGLAFLGGLAWVKDSVNDSSYSGFLLTLGGLVSKKFDTDFGAMDPYAGYLFEPLFWSDYTIYAHSLFGGVKWEPNNLEDWAFYSELNLSLKDSVFALSLGASRSF